MEILWWFAAMIVAFLLGMVMERYRTLKVIRYEEETIKRVKRKMQLLIEELELTGSGIIIEIEQTQDQLKDLIEQAERKISLLRLNQTANQTVEVKESRQEIIERLCKQGEDISAIARKTGANQGEVKLILGLLNKQNEK